MLKSQEVRRNAGTIWAIWWGGSILTLHQMKLKCSWLIMCFLPYISLSPFFPSVEIPCHDSSSVGNPFSLSSMCCNKVVAQATCPCCDLSRVWVSFYFPLYYRQLTLESKLMNGLGNYKLRSAPPALVELSCKGNKLTTPIIYSFSCSQASNSAFSTIKDFTPVSYQGGGGIQIVNKNKYRLLCITSWNLASREVSEKILHVRYYKIQLSAPISSLSRLPRQGIELPGSNLCLNDKYLWTFHLSLSGWWRWRSL